MITAIGKHLQRLTQRAYQAHGFAYAEILTHWEAIVGPELARFCRPETIRWPRGQAAKSNERRRLGGTLVVKTDGPMAIEVQHEAPRIIERMNTFYGYEAVTNLKIVQGHVMQPADLGRPALRPLSKDQERDLQTKLDAVEDEELKQALERLGRGALSKSRKTDTRHTGNS